MRRLAFAFLFLFSLRVTRGSEVRLIGGKHVYEGRVEIKYDGEWRAICDHKWDKKAAAVVCRMLGFPDALRFTKGWVFYSVWRQYNCVKTQILNEGLNLPGDSFVLPTWLCACAAEQGMVFIFQGLESKQGIQINHFMSYRKPLKKCKVSWC